MHDANTPSGMPEQPQDHSQKTQTESGQEFARDPGPSSDPPTTHDSHEQAGNQPPDARLHAAEQAVADAQVAADKVNKAAGKATTLAIPDLATTSGTGDGDEIGMLGDVELEVRIELGRTRMLVEDVLRLSSDAVVELDKAAGDPVDIYVNGRRIARGEVLVLNENFCIRVSEIVEPQTRSA